MYNCVCSGGESVGILVQKHKHSALHSVFSRGNTTLHLLMDANYILGGDQSLVAMACWIAMVTR